MAVTMGKCVRSGRKHGWLPISPVVWVDDVLIFTRGGEYAQHIVRTLEQQLSGWRASLNDEAQWIALLRAGDSACVNQTMMPFVGNVARFRGSRCARAGTAPRGSGTEVGERIRDAWRCFAASSPQLCVCVCVCVYVGARCVWV